MNRLRCAYSIFIVLKVSYITRKTTTNSQNLKISDLGKLQCRAAHQISWIPDVVSLLPVSIRAIHLVRF
jgi:hypothetical protein